MTQTIEVDGHTIEISSLDKVLFPEAGITKGDLIEYYRRIAVTMIPYMADRPLTMHRFPDGLQGPGFYQKEAPDYFPDWIRRVPVQVQEEGEVQPQVVCDNAATLVYLANQACITPHIWLSRADKLHYPDKLIFDLDPAGDDFERVRFAARGLRHLLEEVGLVSFVMTTGSRGLHLVVPLDRSADFDTVRDFAHDLADVLAARAPDRLTIETRKDKRAGRLFLDYLRNSYAQNSVAPYAVRPRPGATVATPLDWEELDNPDLDSRRYTMQNLFRRLGQKTDPWQGMMKFAYSLDEARRHLAKVAARPQPVAAGASGKNRMEGDRAARLAEIAEAVKNLTGSPLYEYRQQHNYKPVIGEGSPDAAIMFVGEAPGEKEAKTGRPFVGASGRFLNEMLASIGLERESVYITNVVKDRPPNNKDPRSGEIELYAPFLLEQINIIRPRVIVTLGRFAMEFILEQFNPAAAGQKISDLHGRVLEGQAAYGPISIVPLFHPAVALYAQDRRKTLQDDFQVLKQFAEG